MFTRVHFFESRLVRVQEAEDPQKEDTTSPGEYPRTVKHLADEIRLRSIEAYGEAAFARLCMRFAQNLGEGNDYVLYVLVFRLLAQPQPDPKIMQLAVVWLDGHGHGKMTLEMLGLELQRLRSGVGTRPLPPLPPASPTSTPSQSSLEQEQEQDELGKHET